MSNTWQTAQHPTTAGTTSIEHPAVQMITMERGRYYMGGAVQGLALPEREFQCATPSEVRLTYGNAHEMHHFMHFAMHTEVHTKYIKKCTLKYTKNGTLNYAKK